MAAPHTLVHQLEHWASERPTSPAIHGREGSGWKTWTWKAYWDDARAVARGLISLGHEVGDCVAILADNQPEWALSELGIMAARGIPAPIYTTLLPDQVAYIVDHSRAKIAICDRREQLEKFLAAIEGGTITTIEHIVTIEPIDTDDPRVLSFEALLERGREHAAEEGHARIDALTDTETALLIYTSGTTGTPKAVQLEHGGMLFMSRGCVGRFDPLRGEYRSVSYLPLSHVAEQLFTTMFHLETGGEVYFCPDLRQVKDFLVEVRPTFFAGVPRVWEKFQSALEAKLGEATGLKKTLAEWARSTEHAAFQQEVRGGRPSRLRRALANKLVISKIKHALGLDQLRVAGTGAAPIGVPTLEFFASLGITIYEGYGMSETTGLSTIGVPGKPRFGSVGTAIDGVEIRVADDDEVLLKGRNMTRGYLHQPDKTAALIDDEGWLHTGDLGRVDADGFLHITGRKKDLLITAGGKNVAPAEMEGYIKAIPGVGHVVVVGDRKPYLCALVTLDGEAVDDLVSRVGVEPADVVSLARNAKVRDWLDAQVEKECNAKVARYQTIKKVEILPVEWTVDSGELTPTMKIKRNVVSDRYAREIDGFYV